LGELVIKLVQNNFTPGKIQQIVKEEPTKEFYTKMFGRYNSVVAEGFNTTTQKQMELNQLLQLREAGVPVPNSALLEAATIQNKKQLVEAIQQQEQAQSQQQQQMQDLSMQEIQSRIKLTEARSVADEGLGVERYSRVQENQALAIERRAAAEKDRDIGLLNMVKALKEIDDIDITHIQKLLSLSAMLKAQEAQGEENAKIRDDQDSGMETAGPAVRSIVPQQPTGQENPTGL